MGFMNDLELRWREFVKAPDEIPTYARNDLSAMQCGVYVLWNETALKYVGSSAHVQHRILQHHWARKIEFTHYSVIEIPDELMDAAEAVENAYIKALEPPHNHRTKGYRLKSEAAMAEAICAAWEPCQIPAP